MHATVCDVRIFVPRETVLFFLSAIFFVLTRIFPISHVTHAHPHGLSTQVGQCGNQVGTIYIDKERLC